jgi:hypothetical protein
MARNSSFYDNIRLTYGPKTLIDFKLYNKNTTKLASIRARKDFLIHCRKQLLLPKHIKTSLKSLDVLFTQDHPYINKLDNMFNVFKRKVLNLEIKITFFTIKKLVMQRESIRNTISSSTPGIINRVFFDTHEQLLSTLTTSRNKVCNRKLGILTNSRNNTGL